MLFLFDFSGHQAQREVIVTFVAVFARPRYEFVIINAETTDIHDLPLD